MTQDTYRFALEEAQAELHEISGQWEQLCLRKEKVEQVIAALRPLLGDVPVPAVEAVVAEPQVAAEIAPFLVQTETTEPASEQLAPASEEVPEPVFAAEASADPFQRRIENALKHGFGSRESRVMPRSLNGLLSRA